LIDWIDRNTLNMQQHDFDGAISRIFSGLEMVAELKTQGIGPESLDTYRKHMGELFTDEPDKAITVDSVKLLLDHLLLILEYLYIENHNFMDDYKFALQIIFSKHQLSFIFIYFVFVSKSCNQKIQSRRSE